MFNERRYINLAAYVFDHRTQIVASGVNSCFFIVDDYGQLQFVNDQYWREVMEKAEDTFSGKQV